MSRDPIRPDRPAERLTASWVANAAAWTEAVREGRIASRRLATDAAIVEAVLARAPRRALDVGSGEGWLCRALAGHGVEMVGMDASAPLVEAARELGGARYEVLAYADLAGDAAGLGRFDAIVCNFALLDEDPVPLLRALRGMAEPGAALLIQTVHPWSARGDAPYRDGWREERFAGFGDGFRAPMPWYFRTLGGWVAALGAAGWALTELREPIHPETGEPASLLLAATPAGSR